MNEKIVADKHRNENTDKQHENSLPHHNDSLQLVQEIPQNIFF